MIFELQSQEIVGWLALEAFDVKSRLSCVVRKIDTNLHQSHLTSEPLIGPVDVTASAGYRERGPYAGVDLFLKSAVRRLWFISTS